MNVRHQPADAGEARREPGARPGLLEVVDALPFLEQPEERCERADVERGGPQPDEVRDDAAHLAGDHPEHLAALGDLDPHQLLRRHGEAHVVRHGREVVHAVGQGNELIVVPVFPLLLEPRVQVADVGDHPHHDLAVKLHDEPQHTMRRRMLRPDVDEHVLAAQLRCFVEGGLARDLVPERDGHRVAALVHAGGPDSHRDGPLLSHGPPPSARGCARARRAPTAPARPAGAPGRLRRCPALPSSSGLRDWR